MQRRWLAAVFVALALASTGLAQNSAPDEDRLQWPLVPGESMALAPTARHDLWQIARFTAESEWELGEELLLIEQTAIDIMPDRLKSATVAEGLEHALKLTVVTGRAELAGGELVYVVGMLTEIEGMPMLEGGLRAFAEGIRTSDLEQARDAAATMGRSLRIASYVNKVVAWIMDVLGLIDDSHADR